MSFVLKKTKSLHNDNIPTVLYGNFFIVSYDITFLHAQKLQSKDKYSGEQSHRYATNISHTPEESHTPETGAKASFQSEKCVHYSQ